MFCQLTGSRPVFELEPFLLRFRLQCRNLSILQRRGLNLPCQASLGPCGSNFCASLALPTAFWQPLRLVISPFKRLLIRALRAWLEAQDGVDLLDQAGAAFVNRIYADGPVDLNGKQTVQEPEAVDLSTTIHLGSEKRLSKKDLLGALYCSLAVYALDNCAAENIFKKAQQDFPTLDQFLQVHTSVNDDDGWKYKYLVAYAADAIFIAFRGTQTLVDVADSLTMTKRTPRHGGKFHAGFLKRSEAFLGPNNKLDGLLNSGKRIILCGHSLGGAVAHMVLLRYLLEKDLKFTKEDPGPSESLFSIAFGAPHACDRLAAGIINEDEDMKWRFINFVNQADPVPRFLDNLSSTVTTVMKKAPSYFTESDSILTRVGGFAGQLINSNATGQTPDWGGMVRQVGGAILSYSWKKYVDDSSSKLGSSFRMLCEGMTHTSSDPEFHPVGQYVFLTRRRPQSVRDEWGPWKHNIEQAQNREMIELSIIKYCGDHCDLENHTLMSYKTALIRTSFLDSPQLNIFVNTSQSSYPVVSTPSPRIISGRLDTSAKDHDLLRIKGQNLLFLYEPVRFNDRHDRWQILSVTDTELVLRRAPKTSKWVRAEPAMLLITIKTAFGSVRKHIPMQEPVKSHETQSLLRTLVQVLALKASSPMNHKPKPNVLEQLDHIVQCATLLENSEGNFKYLSTLFTAIHGAEPETDITQHIVDANNVIEKVLTFLLAGRFESIDLEPLSSGSTAPITSWSQYLWKGMKITALVSGAVVGTGAIYVFGGAAAVDGLSAYQRAAVKIAIAAVGAVGTAGAASTAGTSVYRGLTTQPGSSAQRFSTLDEYPEWLKLAIEEASKWKSGGRSLDNTVSSREPAALETKLVEQVEAIPEFKKLVEHSYCNDPQSCSNRPYHDVKLRSPKFGAASPTLSPKQMLQRINIVVKTHALYKEVVGENFVTVVGAEDAGKSAFIEDVIKKFRSESEIMPKTGVDYHTKDVKSYRVTNKLCLVDFPGGNGIGVHTERWQQFSMLPGSAILFLHFQDDLKIEQKQMYETMKQGLEKNPIVVFNKVDLHFTPENDELYTPAYFKNQKEKIGAELKCDPNDVYHMSLRPNQLQDEKRIKMMRDREVLDLETFADKVLNLRERGGLSKFQLCS